MQLASREGWLARLRRQHQALPRLLKLQWMLPTTIVLVIFLGVAFTLPPGPLCDEGMVIFMEGGCDWGESNVFFFSKLGLLVVVNVAFLVGWWSNVAGVTPFMPHLLVAGLLAWTTRSGGFCDTYYSHPNGSVGQMVIEIAAFAVLGAAVMSQCAGKGPGRVLIALAAWNVVHVTTFYVWLFAFNHWTWLHTFAVAGSMLVLAIAVSSGTRRRANHVQLARTVGLDRPARPLLSLVSRIRDSLTDIPGAAPGSQGAKSELIGHK